MPLSIQNLSTVLRSYRRQFFGGEAHGLKQPEMSIFAVSWPSGTQLSDLRSGTYSKKSAVKRGGTRC